METRIAIITNLFLLKSESALMILQCRIAMTIANSTESLRKRALQKASILQAGLSSGTSKSDIRFVAEKRKSLIPRANISLMEVLTDKLRKQKYDMTRLPIRDGIVAIRLRTVITVSLSSLSAMRWKNGRNFLYGFNLF